MVEPDPGSVRTQVQPGQELSKDVQGQPADHLSYLLKLCINLREESRFLIFEEHAQRSTHVQIHDSQQADGCRPNSRVGGTQRRFHVVDKSLHIDAGHTRPGVSACAVIIDNR